MNGAVYRQSAYGCIQRDDGEDDEEKTTVRSVPDGSDNHPFYPYFSLLSLATMTTMSEEPGNQRASEAATSTTEDIWIETKAEGGAKPLLEFHHPFQSVDLVEGVKIITQSEVTQKLKYLEALRKELAKNANFVEHAMNKANRLNRQIKVLLRRVSRGKDCVHDDLMKSY